MNLRFLKLQLWSDVIHRWKNFQSCQSLLFRCCSVEGHRKYSQWNKNVWKHFSVFTQQRIFKHVSYAHKPKGIIEYNTILQKFHNNHHRNRHLQIRQFSDIGNVCLGCTGLKISSYIITPFNKWHRIKHDTHPCPINNVTAFITQKQDLISLQFLDFTTITRYLN